MNRLGLLRRIEELRVKNTSYESERALSLGSGAGPDFLRKLRTGQTKDPGAENLALIAAALNTTLDDLMEAAGILNAQRVASADHPGFEAIKVLGSLQAGIWREAMEWAPADQRKIAVPIDPRFPKARRFGLQLEGDSMNLLYPLPKTVVICVRFAEIDEPPQSGKVVVVQRWHHDLVEATCKVYVEREDGTAWLEPRSSNPTYKPVRLVRTKKELTEVSKAKLPAVVHAGELPDYPGGLDKLELAALVTGSYAEQ